MLNAVKGGLQMFTFADSSEKLVGLLAYADSSERLFTARCHGPQAAKGGMQLFVCDDSCEKWV